MNPNYELHREDLRLTAHLHAPVWELKRVLNFDITNQQTDQNDKRCIYYIIGSHSRYLSC
jgi:hypothetical protein